MGSLTMIIRFFFCWEKFYAYHINVKDSEMLLLPRELKDYKNQWENEWKKTNDLDVPKIDKNETANRLWRTET